VISVVETAETRSDTPSIGGVVERGARSTSRDFIRERVEALYQRHKAEVFRLALRYGGGRRAWAEDVTHDVFVALLESIGRLDRDDELGGWFYRVTTRRCLHRLERERSRARALVRWLVRAVTGEGPRPDAIASARIDLDAVAHAFDRLSPKEQIAFSMYHLDGKDQLEIARVMGHSKGYVSKLLARAERAIAISVKGEGR
jgi:RNA polymerase sigma-70 factor, ECF subfamily